MTGLSPVAPDAIPRRSRIACCATMLDSRAARIRSATASASGMIARTPVETWSYAQLRARVRIRACALTEAGVKRATTSCAGWETGPICS